MRRPRRKSEGESALHQAVMEMQAAALERLWRGRGVTFDEASRLVRRLGMARAAAALERRKPGPARRRKAGLAAAFRGFLLRLAAVAAFVLFSVQAAAQAERLVRAYPDHLSHVDGNALVWRDGTRMPISDGQADKDFETLLNRPDIDDMFRLPYRPGPMQAAPAVNEDPGRIRHEPFFRKMYGDCARGEVQRRLRPVRWMPGRGGGSVQVTTVNGVADRLEAVVRELEALPKDFARFLVPSAGTFACRTVAGTDRRSMHAYGAAIDINVRYADYWRWTRGSDRAPVWRNAVPFEIVGVFERHGFIWGGKWHHFDTMHFEYRPELLAPSPPEGAAHPLQGER